MLCLFQAGKGTVTPAHGRTHPGWFACLFARSGGIAGTFTTCSAGLHSCYRYLSLAGSAQRRDRLPGILLLLPCTTGSVPTIKTRRSAEGKSETAAGKFAL